ncbi:hypothetical protein N657DRAFT_649755 [Parathielavia appendiculata]|uniref:Uncharacterized protein n=1 Tax=Parathielavia appendiculata TaxID=2587402 RepID=A0AAN6TSB6_9PEZI|nr:hypothetical protein N657DRAFT_649755 [Parathielavia appendiculata]
MSDSEEVSYSREATIATITDYYTFLTRMYMNESQVIYPPTEGWPSIVNADPGKLQDLGKSDEVLSLLAHLPYIRCPGDWNYEADAVPRCSFEDWSYLFETLDRGGSKVESVRDYTEGFPLRDLSLPHVIGLSHADQEDSPVILLDTELDIIHWEDCTRPYEVGRNRARVDWEELKKDRLDLDDLDDVVSQTEKDWRYSASAWAIPDFFEVLKDEFRTLNWVPISPYTVRGSKERWTEVGMMSMLKEIYRQHGWPDLAAYRKTEWLEAVRRALVENSSRLCVTEANQGPVRM